MHVQLNVIDNCNVIIASSPAVILEYTPTYSICVSPLLSGTSHLYNPLPIGSVWLELCNLMLWSSPQLWYSSVELAKVETGSVPSGGNQFPERLVSQQGERSVRQWSGSLTSLSRARRLLLGITAPWISNTELSTINGVDPTVTIRNVYTILNCYTVTYKQHSLFWQITPISSEWKQSLEGLGQSNRLSSSPTHCRSSKWIVPLPPPNWPCAAVRAPEEWDCKLYLNA